MDTPLTPNLHDIFAYIKVFPGGERLCHRVLVT